MNWKTRLKDENTERGIKGKKTRKKKNNSTKISKNLENERHESRSAVY